MLRRFIKFSAALVAATTMVLVSTASVATAGHYYLEDVDIVPQESQKALEELGVEDTKQLLERLETPEGRADTAAATGLSNDEIEELAHLVELMQIIGIGPKAARLLRAAGVENVTQLAGADVSELTKQLVAANAEHQITGVDPDEMVVQDWVNKAGSVKVTLQ